MKLPVRTIGLMLLAACPNGLSAQTPGYSGPAPSAHDVMAAAYPQPAVSAEKASVATEPRQTPAAETSSAPNAFLPLRPPAPAGHALADKSLSGVRSLITVGGSLTAVLGLFFLVAWMLRRASPGRAGNLPPEVFETLGRAALANASTGPTAPLRQQAAAGLRHGRVRRRRLPRSAIRPRSSGWSGCAGRRDPAARRPHFARHCGKRSTAMAKQCCRVLLLLACLSMGGPAVRRRDACAAGQSAAVDGASRRARGRAQGVDQPRRARFHACRSCCCWPC